MFCKNCGNELKEESKFCPSCGYQVPDSAQTDEGSEIKSEISQVDEAVSPVLPVTPKKGQKKVLFSVIAAVLAVLIAVGVFAGSSIKNSVTKLFMSPDEYLLQVQEKNTQVLAESIAKQLGFFKNNLNMEDGASAKLSVTLGDELKKLITSQVDDEAVQYLEWIDSAGLKFDVAAEDNGMGCNVGVSLNSTDIASANMVMDFTDEAMYVSVPEVNTQGIRIPFDEANISPEASTQMLNGMREIMEIVPDEKIVADLICRYIHCAAEQIKNVTESKENISINGITQKSTVLTATIDELTAINMLQNVLKEFSGDSQIKKIIVDFAEFAGEDGDAMVAELEAAAAENIEALEDAKATVSAEENLKLQVWVDSKGSIDGLGFSMDEAEITYFAAEDGSKFAYELNAKIPGATFRISGNGSHSGSKTNAKYTISFNDTEVLSVTCTDLDSKSIEKGMLNGKFVIEPSAQIDKVLELAGNELGEAAAIIPDVRLEITASAESADSLNTEIVVYYKDKEFVALGVEANALGDVQISKPVSSIDSTNMDSWTSTLDLSKVTDAIEKAGAPEALVKMLRMTSPAAAQ